MTKTAPAKAKRPKIKWLGNKATGELHRVIVGEPHPAQCNLDLDSPDLVPFRVASDALQSEEKKWDAAKFCNRRFKSRENT